MQLAVMSTDLFTKIFIIEPFGFDVTRDAISISRMRLDNVILDTSILRDVTLTYSPRLKPGDS
jgi:hypothetical protein